MKRIISVLIILFNCIYSYSCDCQRGSITVEHFNEHDWIFVGKLLNDNKQKKTDNFRIASYLVTITYKGVKVNDTVDIYDTYDSGSCGLGKLVTNREYLIYAKGRERKWTSRCVGTTRLPLYKWPEDSAAINHMKTKVTSSVIYDTANSNFYADTVFLNTHINGIKDSMIKNFYDRYGKISAKGQYINGIPHGFWKYYDRGELTRYGKYVEGKKDSMWVERGYRDGAIDIWEYVDGNYTHKHTSVEDGKVVKRTEPIGNSRKWVETTYHKNGRVKFIAYANPPKIDEHDRLQAPKWDSSFASYNKAGILIEEGNLKDGHWFGHWKYYYHDGKIRMEGGYKFYGEGNSRWAYKDGIWKIYYPNHNVKAIGTYTRGEKSGTWKYYDENGKELSTDEKFIEKDEDPLSY
jgi:antitoxin component YwqK of YwqJK toxin-antitoxin module